MLNKEQRKEQDRKIRETLGLDQDIIDNFRYVKVFKDGANGKIGREEAIDTLLDLGFNKSISETVMEKFMKSDSPEHFRKVCKAVFDALTWDDPDGLTYDVDEMLESNRRAAEAMKHVDKMWGPGASDDVNRTIDIILKIEDKTVTADELHEVVGLLEKYGMTLGQALKMLEGNNDA